MDENSADLYEREADEVAERIMRTPESGQPDEGPKSEHTTALQANYTGQVSAMPPNIRDVLGAPGEALEPMTRGFMEQRFGRNFGQVRVHTDTRAAESARAVNARAYTVGQNIVFAENHYAPGTDSGKNLLAHELTHVLQQAPGHPSLQRKPDQAQKSAAGDLQLPWKHGDYSFFEVNSSGIRFLAAVDAKEEERVRTAIPSIAKRISADNTRITDLSSRVLVCLVAGTTTRFALWNGKPVLALDPSDLTVETAAHEMGHAIFYALKLRAEGTTKDSAKAGDFRLAIADIYARLSDTTDFTEGGETHPAGLWIVDPSQWVPGGAKEHPWTDPDEFFASAKAAYQTNRKGLQGAIARFKKLDAKVEAPGKQLLALLEAFFGKGELSSRRLSEERSATARKELERETGVSKVEETLIASPLLDWLLNPEKRPEQRKARPEIESPY
jgi:hypothetical protein